MAMTKEEFRQKMLAEQKRRKIAKARKAEKDIDDYTYKRTIERRTRNK